MGVNPAPLDYLASHTGAPISGDGGGIVPGFPTEGPREFAPTSPVMIRRLSSEDKTKLKTISIENDSTGWITRTLFKKEVEWPRELYLNILGCKALLPPAPGNDQKPLETATASVTTDGEGESIGSGDIAFAATSAAKAISFGAIPPNEATDGEGQGAAARKAIGQMLEFSEKEAGCNRVREVGSRGGSYDSSVDGVYGGDTTVDGVGGLGDEEGVTSGMECFVQIRNATTGRDLRTKSIRGGANPVFCESLVVPCQGPRDAIVLSVYYSLGGEQDTSLGEAALPLDSRVVGMSQPSVLSVKDTQGRNRGFLRVEAFWVDEAKPRKERGEFYYRVVYPNGVYLRSYPSMSAEKTLHVIKYGEVFMANERQWHAGDGDGTTFVKVSASRDRWARSGWCFETICHEGGSSEIVLERVSSPRREVDGARLHTRPDVRSKLSDHVLPEGLVLEASEKWTPAGSSMTFVTVDNKRGYIIQRYDEKVVVSPEGQPALEQVACPEGVVISSAGVGVDLPEPDSEVPPSTHLSAASSSASSENGAAVEMSPSMSPPRAKTARAASLISAAESRAAAEAIRRLYRVRSGDVVGRIRTPDIDGPMVDEMEAGTAFYSKAEVVKRYEGIGDVAFVMRELDGLWVRANRPGGKIVLDCFTNRVEAGAFTYRVSHENGVLVRTAPGLEAPPVKPRRILPVTKLINVCERLTRAEDIMSLSRPPMFLRLAGNDGWVFDRRGHTLVCEDVTVKSKIATVNAITAEAARVSLDK